MTKEPEKKDQAEKKMNENTRTIAERKSEKLKNELEVCQKQKEEYLAGWQRERADFINYKKEELEKLERLLRFGKENLIAKILPILDDFELAEKNISNKNENDANGSTTLTISTEQSRSANGSTPLTIGTEQSRSANLKGFLQIKKKLEEFLKKEGVEELEVLGKKFDPYVSEAIEEIENKEMESGTVIEVIKKGYKLNEKVIRPAKVKIVK